MPKVSVTNEIIEPSFCIYVVIISTHTIVTCLHDGIIARKPWCIFNVELLKRRDAELCT